MKNILICHSPFCTPAGPSYAAAYLSSFLKQNLPNEYTVSTVDLNLLWHHVALPDSCEVPTKLHDYRVWAKEFLKESRALYEKSNRAVVAGNVPDHIDAIVDALVAKNPDVVLFSVVYNSQVFYTKAVVDRLRDKGVTTIIGGPSAVSTIGADHHFHHEVACLEFLLGRKVEHDALVVNRVLDFSDVSALKYVSPGFVIPVKSSNTCYYQRCTFCTHHTGQKYVEYSLDDIYESIVRANPTGVFFIDDMLHRKRIEQICERIGDLCVPWICQLRPTADLTREVFDLMYDAGCRGVVFGVESASNRILDLMRKGTKIESVSQVLRDASASKIKVGVYIMFGFPTETEEEFYASVKFLEDHAQVIDLVSPAVFGLQEGAPILDELDRYEINKVDKRERSVLPTQISYQTGSGLTRDQARQLYRKVRGRIKNINVYPSYMNFFREHWLSLIESK